MYEEKNSALCLNIILFHRNFVNKKIDLLFIILIHANKMKVAYYRVNLNGYYPVNEYDCPIAYYFKKYSLNNCLPLPRAKRYLTGEYVAVIPSSIEDTFINVIVKDENCIAILLHLCTFKTPILEDKKYAKM